MKQATDKQVDPKAWARSLRNRHMAGERFTITQVEMFRAALRQEERRAAAQESSDTHRDNEEPAK